jgi:hypothetical protein
MNAWRFNTTAAAQLIRIAGFVVGATGFERFTITSASPCEPISRRFHGLRIRRYFPSGLNATGTKRFNPGVPESR